MPKKSLSSLELTAIVNELQFLVKGKITQTYHQENEFIFQLHLTAQGKVLLKVVPGKYLCLTEKKDVPLKPSSFCMQLRKYLDNVQVKKIEQKGSERIVIFELEKKEKYYLIVELFSTGNLILTDEQNNIIAALVQREWKNRRIKVREKYAFPEAGADWKSISEKELTNLFKKSEKKNVVTSLATELGLGGLYAEEVCALAEIDKNKLPKDITEKEVKSVIKTIKQLLELVEKSAGYIYEEQITPFPLAKGKELKKTKTYNEAIDTLNPFKVVSPYQQKIKSLERMIHTQEEAMEDQEGKISLNQRKGEVVYENYTALQKLLDFVREQRKLGREWKEIETELKKLNKIKKVDLANKRVVVDF